MSITQDRLKEVLSYDQDTGVFVWIKTYRNIRLGKVAGAYDKDGYITIKCDGRHWRAHHLAWLYVYGKLPSGVMDHIDGNRENNAISNLRETSCAGNSQNQRKAHKDSTHKMLGVDLNKSKGRFRARIQVNGKRYTIGGFSNPEDAHNAYVEAKRRMHTTCTI